MARKTEARGSIGFTLTEQMRDTIRAHGAEWALYYYAERMPLAELLFFWRIVYPMA